MKVQDFKYTKVGEYLYFGVEVNNSDTSAYIGSYLKVNAGEQSMSVPLPYISPQSTIGIGFIIKSIPNPEAITIDVVTGTEHFEYPYSDDLEVVVKEANEATRTITYTIANKGNVEISDASFDLIFYNKGQLVGGLRQKIDKLMPSRTHYVDVRIPPEIVFTEAIPSLLLPPSNRFTFLGFYLESLRLGGIISENQPIDHVEKVTFEDRTPSLEQAIVDAKEAEKELKKTQVRSRPRALWHIFIESVADGFFFFPIPFYFSFIWIILAIIAWVANWDAKWIITFSVPALALGGSILSTLYHFLVTLLFKKNRKKAGWFSVGMPKKEKKQKLQDAAKDIEEKEKELQEYNIEEHRARVDAENNEITTKNQEIDTKNEQRKVVADAAKSELSAVRGRYDRWDKLLDGFTNPELQTIHDVYKSGVYDDEVILNELEKVLANRQRMEDKQEAADRHSELISEIKYQGEATRDTIKSVGSDISSQLEGIRADNAAHAANQAAQTAELISATRAQTRQLRSISTAVNYANSQNAINGLYTRGIYNNTWGH